jgi:hypothetical protein
MRRAYQCLGFHQSELHKNATGLLSWAVLVVELARSLAMLEDAEKDCLSRDIRWLGMWVPLRNWIKSCNSCLDASMLLSARIACRVSLVADLLSLLPPCCIVETPNHKDVVDRG